MSDDKVTRLSKQSDDLDKRLDARRDEQFAGFLGQLMRHVDGRIDGLEIEMISRLERLDANVDGIAERLDTDSAERTALTGQGDLQETVLRRVTKKLGMRYGGAA